MVALLGCVAFATAAWRATEESGGNESTAGFRDFAVQLTNADIFDTSIMNFGVKVAEGGSYTATTANDVTANFTVKAARFNDKDHGWVNCEFTVPVQGPVKIGLGNCQYGSQDGTITDAAGNVTTLTKGNANCWHNNKDENISYTIYKGTEATTLTIKYNGYCPFISVAAIDPSELKSDATVSFAAGEAAGALVPAAIKEEVGKAITLPKNFTMYVEGKTLTGWTDGTNTVAPGAEYTVPEKDVELAPVFTANEVSLADRTEAVTLKWTFRRDEGAPTVAYQNQNGIWVTQADVNGKTIDVKVDFDTNNGGKFANGNWNDWAQLNKGTKWTIPSCKGATVSIEAYSELGAAGKTATTIDGQSDYTSGKTISYEIAGGAETVDVVIGDDGSYYRYIQIVLPVVQSQGGGEKFDNVNGTITWPLSNEAEGTMSEAIAQAIQNASFTMGTDLTASAKTYLDESMTGYQPGTGNAGNVETVMLEYRVKAKSGLTFKPTNVSYNAVKDGTDNATYSWSYTVDGQESTITTVAKDDIVRNNNTTGTPPMLHSHDINIDGCSEFTFRIYVSGFGNTKKLGINNVVISGNFNGTAANVDTYNLTAVAAPEEGGSVSKYPNADEYEAGSEVTLTATENFGYDFVNWTNAAGEEISNEAKFKYTVTANETLTANFKKVETYALNLNIDGTNDYMVTVSPAPTVVDGKNMYEAGQKVVLTANQYEGLVTFTNWNDGTTNSEKTVTMDANQDITASYSQADIIAGWDFYKAGGNGRKADFAAQDNDADALNLVNTETGETQGWLDKSTLGGGGYESFKGAAVNWRTGAENGDVGNWHWQTKINAEAFTDINVQFQMLYNYNAYQKYNVEYSLNGTDWTNFGSITMEGAKNAASFSEKMPEACNNQTELYIRMIADKTSNVDGSASKNDGNTLAMFFITGTPKLVDDPVAPALLSSVPENNAEGASATGKIVLNFDKKVQVVEGTKATLGSQELTPAVSGKVITFSYKGLEYNTDYTFTLPANTVKNLTGATLTEAITINFKTMARPTVTKAMYDQVVSTTEELVAALQAAQSRADKNVRYRIFLKKGTYTLPQGTADKTYNVELANATQASYTKKDPITYFNAQNVSIIGEDRDATIITNTIPADDTFASKYGTSSIYEGIGNSDVFQISSSASGLYWQDLTVSTGMEDARGRDIAIQDKGTKNIYKNVCLHGYQDTWTSNNDNGLYFFDGGVLRGRTDYICGKGDIYFKEVEFRQIAGGYCAVPSKPAKVGWVMKDCVINGDGDGVDGNYTLGRPWGNGTPVAVWIDTKMNVVPSAIGWNEMSGGWPARFAEYNSMTSTGSQIDLSGRKTTFGDGHANNPVLTAEEAAQYSDMSKMFGDWQPTLMTEQAPAPQNVKFNKNGNILFWDGSNYALLYAVCLNGNVIGFTTDTQVDVTTLSGSASAPRRAASAADYTVRAANEMGGLSEASAPATETDGIETIEQAQPVINNEAIYNLQGVRVDKATKGVYIINGKKVVIK